MIDDICPQCDMGVSACMCLSDQQVDGEAWNLSDHVEEVYQDQWYPAEDVQEFIRRSNLLFDLYETTAMPLSELRIRLNKLAGKLLVEEKNHSP